MAELTEFGTQPTPLGLTVGFFKRFVDIHGGRGAFEGLTTVDVCTRFLMPYTAATKLSLVEHVHQQPDGHLYAKPATCGGCPGRFLSRERHGRLSCSVVLYILQQSTRDRKQNLRFRPYWFGIFRSSLRSVGNVVMVMSPWNNPMTLTRTWCVFEVYTSIVENARFEIAMGRSQKEAFLQDIQDERAFTHMLSAIQSEKSQTTIPSDRDNIFKLIHDEDGFSKLDRMVFDLQEERLKTLAERSDWSDYACRHRAYKAYCVENNVPLHERLPKESFMADRADVKATNCCPFSFQRLLSLVFRK
ncbi:hypothetical protein LEN26_007069 [Aphanomyces euteiches]|nr:hypothetical protein LEN26_007069 [Aphanomyces euteiches]KAH9184906.1 hypothetical protein AeNC1_013121 [Aphanomyces euteiches]